MLGLLNGHQGTNPDGHNFVDIKCFLNTSINKKPIFVLEVVNCKKKCLIFMGNMDALLGRIHMPMFCPYLGSFFRHTLGSGGFDVNTQKPKHK